MRQRLYSQGITLNTQTGDDAHSHGGYKRVMAKSLTRINIADVRFNHGQTRAFDGVVQGYRSVCERARIENGTNGMALLAQQPISMNVVDQFAFVVTLHKVHL